MSEESTDPKSGAERWFEEQRAWQKTMQDYADAMAQDEQFLTHLGNAMRGSLLAGTAYPQPQAPGAAAPGAQTEETDKLDKILFALKRIEGRLRDIETALDDMGGTPKGT